MVVVPALNEQARIGACLASLAAQAPAPAPEPGLRVMVSDNASQDGTAELARSFDTSLNLTVRIIARLGPSSHFIDAGRWALAATDGEMFALLAGDDTWSPGFAAQACRALAQNPDIDVVYPTCIWEDGDTERRLPPTSLLHRNRSWRQLRALALPDRRELANLVYGVYRRAAFHDLLAAWERGGDDFGSDYAAAFSVIGAHRTLACEQAVSRRYVRAGADLLARVDMAGAAAGGPIALGLAYVRLNLRINKLLGVAVGRVSLTGWRPAAWQVQLIRAPQWIWGALAHLRARPGVSDG